MKISLLLTKRSNDSCSGSVSRFLVVSQDNVVEEEDVHDGDEEHEPDQVIETQTGTRSSKHDSNVYELISLSSGHREYPTNVWCSTKTTIPVDCPEHDTLFGIWSNETSFPSTEQRGPIRVQIGPFRIPLLVRRCPRCPTLVGRTVVTKKKTGRVRTQMEMSRALPRRWNSRRTKRTRSHLHAPSVHFTKCLNSTQNRPRCTPGPEVWCSLPSTKIRSELPHAPEVYREVSPYFNGADKYIHRNGDADTPRVLTSVNGVFLPHDGHVFGEHPGGA